MYKLARFLAIAAVAAAPASAHAAAAHVHGAAALHVAVEGNRLLVEFSSPLDNLVGFERAPRNDKENAAVRAMASKLREAERLFVPTPDAKCTRAAVTLASPVLDRALLGDGAAAKSGDGHKAHKGDKGHKGHKDAHASIDADIEFRCERPQSLTGLEVKAFDAFPNLKQLEVKIAGAKKQSSAKLTPRNPRVSW